MGNLNNILGAGIDTVVAPVLPAPVGLMVALRVVGALDEFVGQTVELHSQIKDPDDQPIGDELSTSVGPVEAPDARQDWPLGIVFSLGFQWPAETEGTYTVNFRVGSAFDAVPLHVVLG